MKNFNLNGAITVYKLNHVSLLFIQSYTKASIGNELLFL